MSHCILLNILTLTLFIYTVARKTGKCVSHVIETKKLNQEDQWKIEALGQLAEGEPTPKKLKLES